MAIGSNTTQGYGTEIAGYGQIFKQAGESGNLPDTLLLRTPTGISTLNTRDVGRQLATEQLTARGIDVNKTYEGRDALSYYGFDDNSLRGLAQQKLKASGIDIANLPTYNFGDTTQFTNAQFNQGYGQYHQNLGGDVNSFLNAYNAAPKTGGNVTIGANAENPFGTTVNVDNQQVQASPSLDKSLQNARTDNPNVTPAQASSLAASGMANAGANGQATPYSPEQVNAAGVAPKQPAPVTPTGTTAPTGQPGQQSAPPATNLQPGQSGPEVAQLQNWLLSQGYAIPSIANGSAQPGYFGPETKMALTKWQQDHGVQAGANFGFWGPLSQQTANSQLQPQSPQQQQAATAAANNATPTGQAISAATGMSATDYLKTMEVTLATGLGSKAADAEISGDKNAINNFFSTQKTASQILQEEFQRRGIEEKQTMLNELDKRINDQTKVLRDLPDAIKNSLQDVGVTQDQLTRLIARDSQKPSEILRDLLTERGALASEINQATSFAEKFADTQLQDQATHLAALQWNLQSDQGDLANLKEDQKYLMGQAIDEQKNIMNIALDIAKAGAPQNIIDSVVNAKSIAGAMIAGGHYLYQDDTKKQQQDTMFNLAQQYPDAGILPTDSFQTAQAKVVASPSYRLDQQNTRSLISDRNKPTGGGSNTGGSNTPTTDGYKFTQDQLQKASALGNIPLADLKTLPGEVINVFTSGQYNELKKGVKDKLDNFETASDIEREISESNAPDPVKDALVRYLKQEAKNY